MTKEQILHKFHENFVRFIDELIEQFPSNNNLHLARVLAKDQIAPWKLIEKYIEFILPIRSLVDNRDESFFLNDNEGFSKLPIKSIMNLRELWLNPSLDEEDKNIIWKWMDLFNVLAEKYKEL